MMISFIVPAYNEERYIAGCLMSLLKQKKIPRFEVIVVNNNSTDATAEVVKQFPSVRLVREQKQGMVHARNRGAKEAEGELLVFVDADTMLPESWAARTLSLFSQNPGLVALSGPSKFYDLPARYKPLEHIHFKILFPSGHLLQKRQKKALLYGANIAVRKALFEQVGGFSDIVFYGEDADLAARLARLGDVRFVQSLWVWTSARRLVRKNPVLEGARYVLQYVWFLATNKSRGKTYEEVR